MNDSQISFVDIECPSLRSQAKALIEDLIQLCPSDSTVRATVRRVKNKFRAEIRVASESVMMEVMDQASVLADVLEHVQTKLLSQIVDWRNHRFAS